MRVGDGWGQRDHRNSDRGATLLIEDGEHTRAYPIRGVEETQGGTRILTKCDGGGFVARSGERWRIRRTATWPG